MTGFRFSLRHLLIVISCLSVLLALVGIGWRVLGAGVLVVVGMLFWLSLAVGMVGMPLVVSIQEEISRKNARVQSTSRCSKRLHRRS